MSKSLLKLAMSSDFNRRFAEVVAKDAAARTRKGLPSEAVIDGRVFKRFPDGSLQPVSPEPAKRAAGQTPRKLSRAA